MSRFLSRFAFRIVFAFVLLAALRYCRYSSSVSGPAATAGGDSRCRSLISQSTACEARKWFAECPANHERTLGEGLNTEQSRKLAETFYTAGAACVTVVEVVVMNQDQTSNVIIVELPTEKQARAKMLEFTGRIAEEQGFDPDVDEGQKYDLVMLK